MSRLRLILASLLYYWRTTLALVMGVIVGTAVMAGAFVVGDSVRESLRQMTLKRLGEIDFIVHSPRFFREELAAELATSEPLKSRCDHIAPAIVMRTAIEGERSGDTVPRINNVRLYGVDDRSWRMIDHGAVPVPTGEQVVLGSRTAEALGAEPGDRVTLWVEMPASIPRDTLLGEREEVTIELALGVAAVLDPESGANRLDFNPSQQLPPTAFVPLETLQQALGIEKGTPRAPKPARVNALLFSMRDTEQAVGEKAETTAASLADGLHKALRLEDLNLRLDHQTERGYLSLESERLILEDAVSDAAAQAAENLHLRSSPVFVYIATMVANAEDPTRRSHYAVVAGVDFETLAARPFGPFKYAGEAPPADLSGNRLVVNDWLAQDLNVGPGDDVLMRYYEVGTRGEMPEKERRFTVAAITRLEGTPADDREFTPEVHGITDAESFDTWDAPFEMKYDPTARDEDYWDRYRATPKIFIDLSLAQSLWRNRYGRLTSFRVAPSAGESLEEAEKRFAPALIAAVELERLGLAVRPVKAQGLQAASGTTDFAGLFAGFSIFLIGASAILVGLLFRLGLERRASSVGLLAAVGLSPRLIRSLFLAEAALVIVVGVLIGLPAAIGYADLMIYGLKTWWNRAIGTQFLLLDVQPAALVEGAAIVVFVALAAVVLGLRTLLPATAVSAETGKPRRRFRLFSRRSYGEPVDEVQRLSVRDLLAGLSHPRLTVAARRHRRRRSGQVAAVSALLAVVLLVAGLAGWIPATEAFEGLSWQVVAFFVVGLAVLTASLTGLASRLDADRAMAVRGAGMAALARLGLRNAARNRQRSTFTVALIASATFLVVAVAAGHRDPGRETPQYHSGNGGFWLVAESTTPLLFDPNTPDGRRRLDLVFPAGSPEQQLLDRAEIIPFRVRPGDDASCLNLFQTRLPTILGVPPEMIRRGGFRFVGARRENPWTLLEEALPADPVPQIPVFADMNTLYYSLHKKVGDTIAVPNDEHPEYVLKIVGMFDGSVFQGVLLMSEANFLRLYPEQAGYAWFLIGERGVSAETSSAQPSRITADEAQRLARLLETRLAPFGFDAEPVARRLADFLAVQNTYLSAFQTLGGLGLLLGTLGLGTVMLRNVLERRAELALLRAVGFRNDRIAVLVSWENALLLAWGLLAGTVSALLAMLPHIASIGADVPWNSLGLTLISVFLVGMLAAWMAVREAVRTPVLATLRAE